MKRLVILLSFVICLTMLSGCSEDELYIQQMKNDIQDLENELSIAEEELFYIESNLSELKDANDLKQYVITIEIKQSHFSLNIGDHIKDAANAITIDLPTSKYFYDNVNIGDVLNDDFRLGSFFIYGSFGSWNITIIDKYIMEE